MQPSDWEITVLVLSLRIALVVLEMVKARRSNGEPPTTVLIHGRDGRGSGGDAGLAFHL